MFKKSKTNTDWTQLIDRRVLVEPTDPDGKYGRGPRAYILREVTPSGERVRFEKPNGRGTTFYCEAHEYCLLEDLGDA